MRGLFVAVGIALLAMLVVAALLIVATGRMHVFTISAGSPIYWAGLGAFAMGACWISLAWGVALHVAARVFPRRYFRLMWWRDAAFVISAGSVLVALVLAVGRQFAYGV